MEAGWLWYPGASTIGNQLLDGNCSHGWQILASQPWAPTQKGGQAPVTLCEQWKRGREVGVRGEALKTRSHELPRNNTLAPAKHTLRSKSTWDLAHAHVWNATDSKQHCCSLLLTPWLRLLTNISESFVVVFHMFKNKWHCKAHFGFKIVQSFAVEFVLCTVAVSLGCKRVCLCDIIRTISYFISSPTRLRINLTLGF